MKLLTIIFTIVSIIMFLFGDITINGNRNVNIFIKLISSMFAGLLMALIFGLPILGVISLF